MCSGVGARTKTGADGLTKLQRSTQALQARASARDTRPTTRFSTVENNYTTGANNSPCNGCETRCEACHGQCEKYASWKEFMKQVHKERKKYEIDWREEYKTLLTV